MDLIEKENFFLLIIGINKTHREEIIFSALDL